MFKINDKIEVGNGKLLLMAGPCVAESFEICSETASFLKNLTEDLGINYVFKASYDKANRSSGGTFRGNGMENGLKILKDIKEKFNVPIVTDIHDLQQVKKVAEIADVLQLPAFLCRQTDILVEMAKQGKPINIKKGQFMAPHDMKGVVEKVKDINNRIMLTERGVTFGYNNLVVDMRSLKIMRAFGFPVVFDATHSVQLPGGLGNASGGQREFIESLTLAATAVGIDAIFMEIHPCPDKALCDGPNSLDFKMAENLLKKVKNLYDSQRKGFKN